jgi:hypothetical protein
MIEKVMALFKAHLKAEHDLVLYDYQLNVSRQIFEALIQNLRLTSGASEEDIKKLRLREIPIEFSRQSGKTTVLVQTIEFIMIFFTELFHRPIAIGIFAPQQEQAKTDFDRLKTALMRSSVDLQTFAATDDEIVKAKEESNSKTIVLPNGSSCYIFPVTATSKPESKTLHLIIFEESQDIDDKILREQIWPMGASTNAPRVYIGTAGTQICHFYRLGQKGEALKLYFEDIASQRRKAYDQTRNALHLIYEQTVRQEIEKSGLDSDEIQRPYFGKWLIGTGQFTTQEDLEGLVSERSRTYHEKESECYAGIDVAKNPDSTVVTIIRYNKETGKKQLLNWLELRGDNYQDQFDIITGFDSQTGQMSKQGFLSKYNVLAVAVDSTGIGDFMPDLFAKHTMWMDEHTGLFGIKFSAVSKDMMYKNLKVSIKELLTDLPTLSTREGERFKQQMLDLQQEWKGQLLSVSHPDDPNAHDDYPDSWALAEWAFAKYNENRVELHAIITGDKERTLEKDEAGKVYNDWPGADWN